MNVRSLLVHSMSLTLVMVGVVLRLRHPQHKQDLRPVPIQIEKCTIVDHDK